MRKRNRKYRADGGDISAMEISQGKSAGQRSGMNSRALSMGMPGARRGFSNGGHATDMGFEPKGERLRKTRQRNEILGSPHYSEGGTIHKSMKAVYHALHSHFANDPPMKKLGAKKDQIDDALPHRYNRASGGRLWIQEAINPSKKGSLHKALGVPVGKKIPMSKIKKAEHSKSPLLRKRAHLADTLRKFHD